MQHTVVSMAFSHDKMDSALLDSANMLHGLESRLQIISTAVASRLH